MSGCYRSVCSGLSNVLELQQQKPSSNQHQLTLTAWAWLENGGFLHQFETRLNSSWRTAQFIKWYAVLINVVQACFAIHELMERKRNKEIGNGPGSAGLFRFVGRNMHLMMEMVMLQSYGMAIYGLLKPNSTLLIPYIVLHIATLLLELNYFVTRTALGWTRNRQKQYTSVASSGPSQRPSTSAWASRHGPSSLSMLVFVAFNLLIMIGAKFATTLDAAAVGDGS